MGDRLEKPDKSPDEVAALIEKTQDGDDRAYTELREYVGDNPRFWNRIGDLASATEFRWMQMMLGKDKLQEGVQRRLRSMKRDLLTSGCSPLERLLVDRIAVCWLQVQYADMMYPQKLEQGICWVFWNLTRSQKVWSVSARCRSLRTAGSWAPAGAPVLSAFGT